MNKPPKRQSPRGGGLRRDTEQQASSNRSAIPTRQQGGWSVVVDAGDRIVAWDSKVSLEFAKHVVAQLRRHGFHAHVEPVEVQR